LVEEEYTALKLFGAVEILIFDWVGCTHPDTTEKKMVVSKIRAI